MVFLREQKAAERKGFPKVVNVPNLFSLAEELRFATPSYISDKSPFFPFFCHNPTTEPGLLGARQSSIKVQFAADAIK